MEIAQRSFLQKLQTEIEEREQAEQQHQQQQQQLGSEGDRDVKPLQNPGDARVAEQRVGGARKLKIAPLRLMWRGGKKVRRETFESPFSIFLSCPSSI